MIPSIALRLSPLPRNRFLQLYTFCTGESANGVDLVSGKALAQWHLLSYSRRHSLSDEGRKTRPLAFITRRVMATLIAK